MSRKLPTAILEMKGTLRNAQGRQHEPRPPKGVPPIPSNLSDAERVEWARCVATLLPMGVLTQSDGYALEQLVIAIVEVRELKRELDASDGNRVVDRLHPLYPMFQQSRKELRALWGAFGMDPLTSNQVHTLSHE